MIKYRKLEIPINKIKMGTNRITQPLKMEEASATFSISLWY